MPASRNLCVRACREVQVNDVIGMAYRGYGAKIVFDFDDPMGESTCVACGECVQACPTGALMESSLLDENQSRVNYPDEQVESVCPYCGVGCQITYNLKDGKLLFVDGKEGPANRNRLCVKGRFGFDYVHHEHRLTVPLIRKEGVPKDAHEDVDPANPFTHFREATWEEALDRAADGIRRIRDEYGPKGLAGFGSAKGSNEEAYLVQKLVAHRIRDEQCRSLHKALPCVFRCRIDGVYRVRCRNSTFTACEDAEVMMVIGANPTENHPVAATFLKQQAKAGKTLIICDPRGQALRKHATHMLQFKPGTDVAMLNAMLHVIVEEGLHDEQFVQARTDGFEKRFEHLKDYAPEKMAEIWNRCRDAAHRGANLRDLERLYRLLGDGHLATHPRHGQCPLPDRPRLDHGAGWPAGYRSASAAWPKQRARSIGRRSDPDGLPDYQSVEVPDIRAKFEEFWKTDLDPEKGLTVVEIMDAVHDGIIRGMYVMGENPAMSDPDAQHAREGLAKLEHLVVQDIFLTETAFHADVVLPASAWPEKDGTVTNTNRQVQIGRRALQMPGDARQDWWIIEIATRIGLDWTYTHPSDVFAEMSEIMPPSTISLGIG